MEKVAWQHVFHEVIDLLYHEGLIKTVVSCVSDMDVGLVVG